VVVRSWLLALGITAIAAVAFVAGAHLAVATVVERIHAEPDAGTRRTVVIVPGAGLDSDGTPLGILSARLACAKEIFDRGLARFVLVSGDAGSKDHDEANAMRRWLVARGLPEERIQMDFAGFRTRDTMERAARVFAVKDAVICTQGLHAPRSVYLALDAGIDAIAVVADGDEWLGAGAWLRERAATVVAVYDALINTGPRFLGEEIPIGERASTDR
jgi:SanA protein